ncbi:MAG: hypothetical protein NZM03_03555 [Limisphaera sp.]|nr:hypothetical protein [Limisphaera sp.]
MDLQPKTAPTTRLKMATAVNAHFFLLAIDKLFTSVTPIVPASEIPPTKTPLIWSACPDEEAFRAAPFRARTSNVCRAETAGTSGLQIAGIRSLI